MHLCEKCTKPATVHLTEISNGKRTEVHLCDSCAQDAGYVQQSHTPINELLNQFLKAHAQVSEPQALRCSDCGMTWQEFKDTSLLGCPKDYEVFETQLKGVIEQAQQGATHHTGKSPKVATAAHQAGGSAASAAAGDVAAGEPDDPVKLRQAELARLRKELARAVQEGLYEQAAKLRAQIKALEQHAG
ncbi:MAG: hypothetical protein WCI73_15070 [Phycisphaerae bacterium]